MLTIVWHGRRAFAEVYAAQAQQMAERMGKLRAKEVTQRDAFRIQVRAALGVATLHWVCPGTRWPRLDTFAGLNEQWPKGPVASTWRSVSLSRPKQLSGCSRDAGAQKGPIITGHEGFSHRLFFLSKAMHADNHAPGTQTWLSLPHSRPQHIRETGTAMHTGWLRSCICCSCC